MSGVASSSKLKHILIVEDDADISKLLSLELEEAGFTRSNAETGLLEFQTQQLADVGVVFDDKNVFEFEGASQAVSLRKWLAEEYGIELVFSGPGE